MAQNNGRASALRALNDARIVILRLQKGWQKHCQAVANTEVSTPITPLLERSTPLLTSILILAQQMDFINKRIKAIENKGLPHLQLFSLDMLIEGRLQFRRSTETSESCLKRFMPRLHRFIRDSKVFLSQAEHMLSARLETIARIQQAVLQLEQSQDFIMLLAENDRLQRHVKELREQYELQRMEEDDFLRNRVEEAEAHSAAQLREEGIRDLRINSLLLLLSTMGQTMARQTLITEYF